MQIPQKVKQVTSCLGLPEGKGQLNRLSTVKCPPVLQLARTFLPGLIRDLYQWKNHEEFSSKTRRV